MGQTVPFNRGSVWPISFAVLPPIVILVANLLRLQCPRETDAWRHLLINVDFKKEVFPIEE